MIGVDSNEYTSTETVKAVTGSRSVPSFSVTKKVTNVWSLVALLLVDPPDCILVITTHTLPSVLQ